MARYRQTAVSMICAWLLAASVLPAVAGPFDTWNCKMQITFDGYKEYEDLADFPVLVILNSSLPGFNYQQFGSANAGDLRFTDASGNTELNYEVEKWDPTGSSYVWVKVPLLTGTGTTNYHEGQWIGNYPWTGQPDLARTYNNVWWAERQSENSGWFDSSGFLSNNGLAARYARIFADDDPHNGWTYATRAPPTKTNYVEGDLVGTWVYTGAALQDRQIFAHFYNGYMYLLSGAGSFWAGGSLTACNMGWADQLLFCDYDPRTTVYPYNMPNMNTNTGPRSIRAYWGKSGQVAQSYTTNGSVWSGNYSGVWHMNEAAAKDSRRTAADGVPNNVTPTTGRIGGGLSFNPAQSSSINFGNFNLDAPFNHSYTIEGWFYRTGQGSGSDASVGFGTNLTRQGAGIGLSSGGKFKSLHPNDDKTFNSASYSSGQWQYISVVHWTATDITSTNEDSFNDIMWVNSAYKGGQGNSADSSGPDHNTATIINLPSSAPLSFGKAPWESSTCGAQIMDEVRISKIARPYNWVHASYLTVASNSSFQTYATVTGLTNVLFSSTNPPGAIQFSSATYSVSETGRYVDVTIQRPVGAGSNVSVHVASSGGSAVAGVDYIAVNTNVSMVDGVDTGTVRVAIANDALASGSKTFNLTMSAPTGGSTLGALTTTTITITDDDLTSDASMVISYGSIWKYNDTGANLDTAWRATNFNDTAWGAGPGPLGYNTDNPATTLSYGADQTNKYITTYLRKTITIADPSAIGGLTLKFKVDDGAVIFVNGVEAGRYLMTNGAYGYQTLATSAAPNEKPEQTLTVSPGLLQPGANVIAVEVHQVSPGSSDIYFDMQAQTLAQVVMPTTFTAYDDTAWTANSGQSPSANDVTGNFTTNSLWGALTGSMINTNGTILPVTLTFNASAAAGVNLLDRAFSIPSGTDADTWFNGKIGKNCAANWSGGSLQMTFSGLNATQTYNIVLWSTRGADGAGYSNRFTDIRITGADAFINRSSSGTELSTVSMASDQTRVRSALASGHVARYDAVNPGSDGTVTFSLTAGSDLLWPSGGLSTNGYLNGVMIQTAVPGSTNGADGVPDSWKIQYFGNTNVDVNADSDGDGVSNLREYIAGCNPTSGGSLPMFEIMSGQSLSFNGVTQRIYNVDCKTNLLTPWMPFITNLTGSNASQTIQLNTTNRAAYYRFRVRLAP